MSNHIIKMILQYLRRRSVRRKLRAVVSILACIVVFTTTYAMLMPVLTLEAKADCGLEEHEHTEACYEKVLICGLEQSEGHQHSEACYNEAGELICGQDESEGHQHTDECYEMQLTCGKEIHIHSADCYRNEEEPEAGGADSAQVADSVNNSGESGQGEAVNDGSETDSSPEDDSDRQADDQDAEIPADAGASDKDNEGSEGQTDGSDNGSTVESGQHSSEGEDADETGNQGSDADDGKDGKNSDAGSGAEEADPAGTDSDKEETDSGREGSGSEGEEADSEGGKADSEGKETDAADTDSGETGKLPGEELTDPEITEAHPLDPEELSPIEFEKYITDKTTLYYLPEDIRPEDAEKEDWVKINGRTALDPEQPVIVHIAYEIPEGMINATNPETKYLRLLPLNLTEEEVRRINRGDYRLCNGTDRTADDLTAAGRIEIREEYEYDGAQDKDVLKERRLEITFNEEACLQCGGQMLSDGTAAVQPARLEGFLEFTISAADLIKLEQEDEDDDSVTFLMKWNKDEDLNTEIRFDRGKLEAFLAKLAEESGETEEITYFAGTLTFEGSDYTVTATFDETAKLPEGTVLKAEELKGEAYDQYLSEAQEAVGAGKEVTGARFFDITFETADGQPIEPQGMVDVRIEYRKAEKIDTETSVEGVHFTEEGPETIEIETEGKEGRKSNTVDAVTFQSDAFSVYGIVYTVDFEYSVNGKMYQYSLLGGGFVSFTDLVEVLGITGDTNSGNNEDENEEVIEEITEENGVNERAEENGVDSDTNTAPILDEVEVSESARKFVADVASVEFSSPELVDVSKVEADTTVGQIKENRALECEYSAGLTEEQIAEINAQTVEAPDWALISLHPFTSEEELTVTMEDGEVFTIRVTDAQIKKNVIDSKGDTWEIIVTCGEDAQIPDGAELKVREILPEDEEYVQYYKKSLEKVGVNAPETEEPVKKVVSDYARLFDIEIWYDDHKVEPAADVTVNIKLLDAPEETEATPQVVHFAKAGAELIELKEKAEKSEEEGIQFVTDEFSVYSVVYTVDFSYEVNGKVYGFTMQGEGSVSLRALIEALHVYEKTADEEKSDGEANEVEASVSSEDLADKEAEQESAGENQALNEFMSDIKSVEFSNPELLAVCEVKTDTTLGILNIENGIVQKYTLTASEPELKKHNAKLFKAGDWALISLNPFDTEECLKIGLTTGEEFTIKVTDDQDAQMVGDHVLTVSNPAGTTIDLFDYWISDDLRYKVGRNAWPGNYNGGDWTNDWTYQNIGLQVEGQGTEAGINEGHAFKFTPAYAGTVRDGTTNYKTEDASGRINSYTGQAPTYWCVDPNQGIVQNTLSSGYPILTNDSAKGTNGESLAYLFDPTISHQGKESYSGVDQFLYVDKDGYYKYDSRDYKADYNDDGTFTLTEQTAEGSDRGFWPFGTSTYWSGMHINTQFSMPENGKVLNPRGEYKDMQFEFSGDDDTWIYVDGVLIGDGGGIHNRCEIDINFATGNVIINNTVVGTLRGFIEAAKSAEIAAFTPEELEKWNAQWNGNTFAAGTYHTFDMFYLERGGDESNLYIKYNLVSTADFTAHKSYSGYDEDDVMQRNQFRFELIGLDGKYRSVWNDDVNDYVLVREDMTSKTIMPHASSTGAGTTVSPYYDDNYSVEMSDGTTVSSQIYITGNVEDGNVNFGNAQISEQDMHDCDEGNPPVYRYIVREVVPDDAVNADNITWANATPEQRAAGGFVKDSIVYDNAVYYMAARVTSWTETDASGTPRTRYGLSKTYYTDDTYTTKKNTPFIDFRNTYQPNFASFEFDKLDANEEPVEGAVFQLFRDSACKIPAKDSNNQNITASSDANGKVTFTDTRTGIYFMKEVSAPEPYDLNPTVYRVTISKQGSHMSVNSDQNNTPVTEVYNLKSTDITVKKKWVNEDGEEVSGEGHPATVQLRRYRYVSTAPAPETHNVTLHFYFPDVGWNTSQMDFGPYQVTGNSVVIHWPEEGVAYRSREGYDDLIIKGNNMYSLQLPLENDLDLNFEGNVDWGYQKLNSDLISVDGTYDNSKELRLDDAFPSEAEKSKATQVLTDEHPMHAWSFGVGDEFDFPPGDELGRYLYYIVELNDQEQEVAIGENVDEDMKLLSIAYEPEKVEGKGITHGLITVTNEVAAETPTTVDITVLKVDDDNNNIKLGGATFELTKVQSLETVNQVSDGGYSESGTTSDADDETKGKLLFTGLTPGYYYLHETESPDGYVITTNGWHFQVDENGIVSGVGDFNPDGSFQYVDENNITVTNQKGAALPNAGGPGTKLFTLLGALLTALAAAGMTVIMKKRNYIDL